MTERERLIELLTEAEDYWLKYVDDCAFNQVALSFTFEQLFADHLLSNGVIVPPMWVGQTCFEPSWLRDEIDECRVSSITQKADGSFKIRITNLHYKGVHGITVDKIGKTVFLTKEEAEKALKERSEGK